MAKQEVSLDNRVEQSARREQAHAKHERVRAQTVRATRAPREEHEKCACGALLTAALLYAQLWLHHSKLTAGYGEQVARRRPQSHAQCNYSRVKRASRISWATLPSQLHLIFLWLHQWVTFFMWNWNIFLALWTHFLHINVLHVLAWPWRAVTPSPSALFLSIILYNENTDSTYCVLCAFCWSNPHIFKLLLLYVLF